MKMIFTILIASSILISCSSGKRNEISTKDRKANIYYAQGTRNLLDKEYTKALKNLLEANSLRENDSRIHTNLGMAYYFKKNNQLALKHLHRAVELDKKNSDAKLNIATIYMDKARYGDAEKIYKEILNDLVYENQFRTYYNLGILELKRNNITKAIEYFNSSTNVEENYCPAYFQLGKIYYKKNSYKKAMKMFIESSMGTCFENPEPHYMQALTLIKMKKYAEATIKLEEMIEKFAMTKYESIARRKLVQLNQFKKNEYQIKMRAQNYDRNILTPDF